MELLQLLENEKTYKKYSKLWGVNTIAICYRTLYDTIVRGSKLNKEQFTEKLKEYQDIKLSYVYESLNDFNMVVDYE